MMIHSLCVERIESDVASLFACFSALFCTFFCNFLLLFMFVMCSSGWSVLAYFLLIFIQILPNLHSFFPMSFITIMHLSLYYQNVLICSDRDLFSTVKNNMNKKNYSSRNLDGNHEDSIILYTNKLAQSSWMKCYLESNNS